MTEIFCGIKTRSKVRPSQPHPPAMSFPRDFAVVSPSRGMGPFCRLQHEICRLVFSLLAVSVLPVWQGNISQFVGSVYGKCRPVIDEDLVGHYGYSARISESVQRSPWDIYPLPLIEHERFTRTDRHHHVHFSPVRYTLPKSPKWTCNRKQTPKRLELTSSRRAIPATPLGPE